jgi:hypothetical protein
MANTSSSFDLSTAVPVDGSAPPASPVGASSGFDLSTAKPIPEPAAKKDTNTDEKPTDWGRQIALGGRAAAQGVVGALTLPATALTAASNLPPYIANTFFGGHYPYKPSPSDALSQIMTKAGAPMPQTSGENLTSAGISGLTGGLAGGGLGAPGIANAVRSGAAGTSGGLSQEGARQMGLPGWLQTAAGLLGSQIPALLESSGRTLADLAAPLTSSGQSRAAGTLLNSQASDPSQAQMNLWQAKQTVPGSLPTAGAASRDAGLLGVEKAMRGRSAPEFEEQLSVSNAARQAELDSIGGTPKDLEAAIQARSQATAPLYAQAAQQSAPIDSEMTALMQRPAMQAAVLKAKEMAENQGRVFGLSANSPGTPMSLTGADLQGMKLALDDMRSTGFTQGIGSHQQRALQSTTDALTAWMQKNVPAQRAADAAFENMSGPVNKMTTVQALKDQASTSTADTLSGQYLLSPSAYDRALDKALAAPRNGLGKPDIARLEALRSDLQSSTASSLLKAPGSDTFQNLSLNQNLGGGLAGLMSKPLGPLYKLGGADQGVNSLLTRAMLNPQFAAGLMQSASKARPGLNLRPYDLGTMGGLLGSQP